MFILFYHSLVRVVLSCLVQEEMRLNAERKAAAALASERARTDESDARQRGDERLKSKGGDKPAGGRGNGGKSGGDGKGGTCYGGRKSGGVDEPSTHDEKEAGGKSNAGGMMAKRREGEKGRQRGQGC